MPMFQSLEPSPPAKTSPPVEQQISEPATDPVVGGSADVGPAVLPASPGITPEPASAGEA